MVPTRTSAPDRDGEAKWGTADGIYSWRVHLDFGRKPLPANVRAINFHGKEDPWLPEVQERCPWIREHYRRDEAAAA